METTAFILAYTSMAIMLTLTCIGSAIGVTIGGNTTVAGLKKNPEMFGKSMLLCVLPSTQGLYGFAAFFLMLSALQGVDAITMNQALAISAASVSLGLVGFYSAVKQAGLVANGINEMANGQDVFSKTMILAVFPELYAILAFACAFLALP
ncbi:MAG: V-type ATP synthase subunit K [Bacteroidales bacterium]|jgi:V/A-type H+-transporting ATPase subunit K|nr:V-type ATP synthase subunit K [Bacteroidales bacterium]MBO7283877.1 V-type ATP synthase subunit K [Bacteroidales bacterium]MBO7322300.1 V-type ATP synthase subunit K [Bacteroidales bacterium]